ncbi:hypothetical protein C8A00DRAFT_37359 [Chaetomidium leptoderma]|uniref:Uncharacterized protein n=1 Tax=Chaetomidium leptoderma TaxID=669021 RepID=A0AAN6ZTU9_9PEZI|nr:hypothetical protein C8A00DRAFT_37359 [Chaetomidium leptoderma]
MAGLLSPPPEKPDYRKELTQVQGEEVLAGYDRILKPLARLGKDGLTRFYADFAWPWKWTNWASDRRRDMGDSDAAWEWISRRKPC